MKKTTASFLLVAATAMALTACGAMPHHDTATTGSDPIIDASGLPLGATVYVDGAPVGTITENQSRFSTQSGTHKVRVVAANGTPVFDGELYFSRNVTRKIQTQ